MNFETWNYDRLVWIESRIAPKGRIAFFLFCFLMSVKISSPTVFAPVRNSYS